MTIYRERLWASAWLFLATALVIPASLLVFLPIDTRIGVVVAAALYAGCVTVLLIASPVIEVTDETFLAGRARLPIRFVGEASAFREPEATAQRGPHLDARAWLLLRGWISPIVKVELTDPEDPTPYWVVSSRHPEKVVDALLQAKRERP